MLVEETSTTQIRANAKKNTTQLIEIRTKEVGITRQREQEPREDESGGRNKRSHGDNPTDSLQIDAGDSSSV